MFSGASWFQEQKKGEGTFYEKVSDIKEAFIINLRLELAQKEELREIAGSRKHRCYKQKCIAYVTACVYVCGGEEKVPGLEI